MSTVVVRGEAHVLGKGYRQGALAMRRRLPADANPHRPGSAAGARWAAGHANEAAGEHIRFGIDVIEAPGIGMVFEEDADVPRLPCGGVDMDWYEMALAGSAALADAA